MSKANFQIDLTGWHHINNSYICEYECPVCYKLYRGEVSLPFYGEDGMEEVPIIGEISSGFFSMKDQLGMVSNPLTLNDKASIKDAISEVVAHMMPAIIFHFKSNEESHFLEDKKENDDN